MLSEDAQAAHERTVFTEFAHVAALQIDFSTIVSRPKGEPDIRCTLNGVSVGFELGRILDEGMQNVRNRRRRGEMVSTSSSKKVKVPEREMLKKKLSKRFAGLVELLLYFDNESFMTGDVPVFGDAEYKRHCEHVMVPLIRAVNPSPYRRYWVFERHRPSVLWSFSPN
jgi:hypothetical protein